MRHDKRLAIKDRHAPNRNGAGLRQTPSMCRGFAKQTCNHGSGQSCQTDGSVEKAVGHHSEIRHEVHDERFGCSIRGRVIQSIKSKARRPYLPAGVLEANPNPQVHKPASRPTINLRRPTLSESAPSRPGEDRIDGGEGHQHAHGLQNARAFLRTQDNRQSENKYQREQDRQREMI